MTDATKHRDEQDADLAQHRAKLQELENAVAGQGMHVDEAALSEQRPSDPEPAELAQLRTQMVQLSDEVVQLRQQNADMRRAGQGLQGELEAARPELEAARASKTAAERQHAELRALGSAELTTRLSKCFRDHQKALTESRWSEAESLADTTKKLTAALREAGELESQAGSVFDPNS